MVLRKPYAFLIKHFRLIHILISILLVIICSNYLKIYNFLNLCIKDSINRYDAINYINYFIFFIVFIVSILMFAIYWLLKYKDKPRKIYLFTIGGYAILSTILLIIYRYLNSISINTISEKVIRLYRDIIFICNIPQFIIIIIMIIRGLGFNIKKFNFERDLEELNLNDTDSEEVEVNININTTDINRGIRKKKRELGYYYQEFKIYILIALGIILLILIYSGYKFYKNNYKIYHEKEYIGINTYLGVVDSYYSTINNNNYIIIKFKAYNNKNSIKMNTGNIKLFVGKKEYSVDKNICYKFNKYGTCYKQQYIKNEPSEYIIVYKIDDVNLKRTYLNYNESYDKEYKIKLDIENID